MRSAFKLGLLLAATFAASSAQAAVSLIAEGYLTGSSAGAYADLSGLTGTLEDGLPANVLGGLGSGLAYAGGNTFLALPDRGPNKLAYPGGAAFDNTISYINRFQTVQMTLTANGAPGALPYSLSPNLTATTLLSSSTPLDYGAGAGSIGSGAPPQNKANTYYFTGRSDNFGPGSSANPANARLDPESIRVSNDGKSVFISDEYGPDVRQFDRSTGKLIKTFTLPGDLAIAHPNAVGASEISGNTSGRTNNKGMEGLAITPDGKTLVGIMQDPLIQDKNSGIVRIVTIDIATGATHEFGYKLSGSESSLGVSDIVALNDHQFIVDERDSNGIGGGTTPPGNTAAVKNLFEVDITGATDITGLTGADLASATLVTKSTSPFLDLVKELTTTPGSDAFGDATKIPSKIEGLAFGQDITMDGSLFHTLWVANDNDFDTSGAQPSEFYVFAFQNSDLTLPGSTFEPQQLAAVPEPASWAMMLVGFGALGSLLRRQRRAALAA